MYLGRIRQLRNFEHQVGLGGPDCVLANFLNEYELLESETMCNGSLLRNVFVRGLELGASAMYLLVSE